MFCPQCKSLMFPYGNVLRCKRCGYEKEIKKKSGRVKVKSSTKEISILEKVTGTLPRIKVACPACGNKEAYYVIRQTRASDEPETRIYRCTKCSETWRET